MMRMNWWRAAVVYLPGVLLALFASCRGEDDSPPAVIFAAGPREVLPWSGQGGGFREWGQTPEGVFGLSVKPEILETWKWQNGTLKKEVCADLPGLQEPVVLAGGRYVAIKPPGNEVDQWPLVLATCGSQGDVLHKWPPPSGWRYDKVGTNRGGGCLAVTAAVDLVHPPPDYDYGPEDSTRIGLVDLSSMEIRWLTTLKTGGNAMIREMVVSEDGKHIALGGWDNGVAVVSATAGKVLWSGRPPNSGVPQYVGFSPDGSSLYAGDGAANGVYRLETTTGKVLDQWFATESGNPAGGYRISCIAVSSDGTWVAAGAGRQVYLFNARSREKARVLAHGLNILEVSFSPDSRRLASVGGGEIRIWEIGPAATRPATSQPCESAGSGEQRR